MNSYLPDTDVARILEIQGRLIELQLDQGAPEPYAFLLLAVPYSHPERVSVVGSLAAPVLSELATRLGESLPFAGAMPERLRL